MPKDIAVVIYTHMYNEHVGGGTHMTSSGRVLPTFPNARYVVQRDAIEEAERPNERSARYYRSDDYEPLREAEQLEVIEGGSEVVSGVWVEPAPGPTAGHQIVIAQKGKTTFAYLGMLVPTSMHLSVDIAPAADRNPEASCRTRMEVRRQAEMESWQVGPVGRDEWVRASELRALDSFSNGETAAPKAPAVKTPVRQEGPARWRRQPLSGPLSAWCRVAGDIAAATSTVAPALPAERFEFCHVRRGQRRSLKHVGTPLQRSAQRLAPPPSRNRRVVA